MDRILACIAVSLLGAGASAQTYTVESVSPMSVGTVAAAASGVTTFLNSADGYILRWAGSGGMISGPYAYSTVSIRCVDQGGNLCSDSGNQARIRVGRTGVNAGRANTLNEIGLYSGTGTIGSGTNETTATIDVPLSGWTASNQVRTFRISAVLPIAGDDSGRATGAASSQYYVYAARYPATPTTGLTNTVTATVRRALTLAKTADLSFGSVVRPSSGSSTVTVSNATGARSISGGNGVLVGSGAGRARFAVTGEPNTAFTITVPSSVTMANGAHSIAVALSSTYSGAQTMPGSGGFTDWGMGGSFTITSAQPLGSYSGNFTVQMDYN